MKIYYIANARMPTERAHGIQLAKMCEAMIKAGADLKLVLPSRANTTESIRSFYGLTIDIPVRRLPIVDAYLWGRWGFLIGSLSFMVSSFFYVLWKRIWHRDAVVYTIDMDQFSFAFIPFLGVPYFVEIHDAKYKTSKLFSFFFKKVQAIFTINAIIKETLVREFALDSRRVAVHPNGIDLAFFDVREDKDAIRTRLNIPLDKKIVVYTGKFYDWKGLDIIPRAAALLAPDKLIYIVGGTQTELESYASTPIPASVICVGHRDYKQIPLWLAAADALLVLGTKKNAYSYEHTSPMKMFEYMAAKKPIVAADTPAIRHIAGEEEVFLYVPDNEASLAQTLERAVGDSSVFRSKVDRAYEKVSHLSWDLRARAILEATKKAL